MMVVEVLGLFKKTVEDWGRFKNKQKKLNQNQTNPYVRVFT